MSTRPVKRFVLAAILLAQAAVAAPREAAAPPEADFLEFLGSWNTGDQQQKWIDPFQLGDPSELEPELPAASSPQGTRHDDARSRRPESDGRSSDPVPDPARSGKGVKP